MPKQGFKNQWIEICRVGEFVDASGKIVNVDDNFLNEAIANFNVEDHEPPICIGHPKIDAPAYGWTQVLRRNGDRLEAKFSDTNDEFEQMVGRGEFKKRSAAFYMQPVRLKHIGFLGGTPPAVKGLRNIQFNDGESVTVEISFSEENQIMEEKDVDKVADTLFDKIKNLFKDEKAKPADAPTTNFSEADVRQLVDDAVKTVTEKLTTEFNEKHTAIETANKTLTEQVNSMSTSGKRSEIVSFVEAIPAEKGKHVLKRAGIVNFMEALAKADEADKEPAINFSEGEGDQKVEHKFSRLQWFKDYLNAQQSFVEFGEKFGTITATPEVADFVDPERAKKINAELGLEKGGDK